MKVDSKVNQYKQLHATKQYGDTSIKNLRYLRPQIRVLAPESIIDYGCGRSSLLDVLCQSLGCTGAKYDPAIPEHETLPSGKYDLLINVDMLEHIPESELPDVVGEMAGLCTHAIIVIDTRPAAATLPNGENAHCTVRSHDWWQSYLGGFFEVVEPIRVTRKSRAAFRTWSLDADQTKALRMLTLKEKLSYYIGRFAGRRPHGG